MNRLDFLKRLFSTAVVAVVTPSLLLGKDEQPDISSTELPSAVPSAKEVTGSGTNQMVAELNDKRVGLDLIVGKRGCGKTHYTKNKIKEYLSGKNPKKVLVLDVNNEYEDIEAIHEDDIIKFSLSNKIEARRISKSNFFNAPTKVLSIYTELGWCNLIKKVFREYKNGHLIIEHPIELSPEVIGAICTTRTFNRPTTIIFNSINQIPPKVLHNADSIQLFKTFDKPKIEKLLDVSVPISIMHNILNIKNKNSDHSYLFLDGIDRIHGKFTEEEWDEAVEMYINETRKSLKDKNYYLRYRA